MKLINGVLKEGRYKKKGRTLDKIWRDSNWGEKRYPGPAEPGKGHSGYILHTLYFFRNEEREQKQKYTT